MINQLLMYRADCLLRFILGRMFKAYFFVRRVSARATRLLRSENFQIVWSAPFDLKK